MAIYSLDRSVRYPLDTELVVSRLQSATVPPMDVLERISSRRRGYHGRVSPDGFDLAPIHGGSVLEAQPFRIVGQFSPSSGATRIAYRIETGADTQVRLYIGLGLMAILAAVFLVLIAGGKAPVVVLGLPALGCVIVVLQVVIAASFRCSREAKRFEAFIEDALPRKPTPN
jgi:hypothetical protein